MAVFITGDIGWDVTLESVRAELSRNSDKTVVISSRGGDLIEGMAIYNLLKSAHVTTIISGCAASIASVIALAGDTVQIYRNSTMLIHNAWSCGSGNAEQLRDEADRLETFTSTLKQVYASRSKLSDDELQRMLDVETLLSAEEAKRLGFVDEIIEAGSAAAMWRPNSTQPHNITTKNQKEIAMVEPEVVEPTEQQTAPAQNECGGGNPEPPKAEEVPGGEDVHEAIKKLIASIEDMDKRITELESKKQEPVQASAIDELRRIQAAAEKRTNEAKRTAYASWREAVSAVGYPRACKEYPELKPAAIKQ